MFSTFEVSLNAGDTTTTTTSSSQTKALRARRSQVHRACDRCRRNRTKCDAQLPCGPCKSRAHACEYSKGKPAHSTAAEAERKIEVLEAKIRQLEAKLEENSAPPLERQASASSPASSSHPSQHGSSVDRRETNSSPSETGEAHSQMSTIDMPRETAHLSNRYFLIRLRAYMSRMLPDWTDLDTLICQKQSLSLRDRGLSGDLSRVQETYMLYLFWHSYHCVMPVVNVPEFQKLHEDLWTHASSHEAGQTRRGQNPLVDIVMALCMQYCGGMGIDSDEFTSDELSDTKRRGLWFYNRCQYLLEQQGHREDLERLQCLVYSTFYCLGAGDLETAHDYLKPAIDLARRLRVFKHKISNTSAADYLQLRIWWQLVVLEVRVRLRLDRPNLLQSNEIPLFLATDEAKQAELLCGDVLPKFPNLAPLTCHTQLTKLALLLRSTYAAFHAKCANLLAPTPFASIYENIPVLETCAASMFPHLKTLQNWARDVPEPLKMKRRGGTADAFSTSKTPLKVEPHKPIWLQRQQIFLEFQYHHTMALVYRLFITFTLSATTGKKDNSHPVAFGHGVLAINHAATVTNMLDQLLSETELMNGWHRALYLQWDAVITLAGYGLANPVCTFAPLVRKGLRTAVANFDALGRCGVPYAASAARQTLVFIDRVDELVLRFGSGRFVAAPTGSSSNNNNSNGNGNGIADARHSASLSPSQSSSPSPTALSHTAHSAASSSSTAPPVFEMHQQQHHHHHHPMPMPAPAPGPLPPVYDGRFKQAFDSFQLQGISFSPQLLQDMVAEPFNVMFDQPAMTPPTTTTANNNANANTTTSVAGTTNTTSTSTPLDGMGLVSLDPMQDLLLQSGGLTQADIDSVLSGQPLAMPLPLPPPGMLPGAGGGAHWMQHVQRQQQQQQQHHHQHQHHNHQQRRG